MAELCECDGCKKRIERSRPKNLCAHGCGQLASEGKKFVWGHNNKTPEARARLKAFGNRPETIAHLKSPEMREIHRRIGLVNGPKTGNSSENITRLKSPENRKKVSKRLKAWWKLHPEEKERLSKINSPTSPELWAQESLARHSEPFFSNKLIEDLVKSDQVLADKKVVIFEDGCYWHGCPVHYPGDYAIRGGKRISENRLRDQYATIALEELGWTVIRVWEHELKKDHDAVGKRLDELGIVASKRKRSMAELIPA